MLNPTQTVLDMLLCGELFSAALNKFVSSDLTIFQIDAERLLG
jgi:hypothetical protein